MFIGKWKKLGLIVGVSLTLLAAGCSSKAESSQGEISASEQMNYTIVGQEPGAGQTVLNDNAIEEYESLSGWKQETSSTGAMLAALDDAIKNEEPVMISAWSPHYMFEKWDIKFLEDPKGVFGETEQAITIARNGLKDDLPNAYTILDRIYFEVQDIEAALFKANEESLDIDIVAEQWVEENQEEVDKWIDGVEPADDVSIELAATPWDEALFTGNVAKVVLEQQGYDIKLTPVDPAVLFKSIATGDADASLSPWLPTTHQALYDEFEGEFEDLGPVFEGARVGLAVPSYMEEDSIEDFKPNE